MSHTSASKLRALKDAAPLDTLLNAEPPAGVTQEAYQLAIINRLLAEQRRNARDHHGDDWHGAAILRSAAGHWYLHANIHLAHTDTSRACAEANAARDAYGREGASMRIAELWFMGGRGDSGGERHTPCGSCRDILYDFRTTVGPETVVHMLPLNEGDMALRPGNPDDTRNPQDLAKDEVFSRRISALFPHASLFLTDVRGTLKQTAQDAFAWLQQREDGWQAVSAALQPHRLASLEKLSGDPQLVEINRQLMEAARDAYLTCETPPDKVTIAIVKSADGHFYIGKHLQGEHLPARHSAEFSAIHQMSSADPRYRLTDIYIVQCDSAQLAALTSAPEDAPFALAVPDGATREILKKNAHKAPQDAEKRLDQVRVHLFVPNIPQREFDAATLMQTQTLAELLPYAYQNPKSHAPPSR